MNNFRKYNRVSLRRKHINTCINIQTHDQSTRENNVNTYESFSSLSSTLPCNRSFENTFEVFVGLNPPLVSRCPLCIGQWVVSMSNSFGIEVCGSLCGDKRDKSWSASISYPSIELISELSDSKFVFKSDGVNSQ